VVPTTIQEAKNVKSADVESDQRGSSSLESTILRYFSYSILLRASALLRNKISLSVSVSPCFKCSPNLRLASRLCVVVNSVKLTRIHLEGVGKIKLLLLQLAERPHPASLDLSEN
jgi:hypothetical protein